MLKETTQLNEDQCTALEHLKSECKKEDGSVPNVYIHLLKQKRALPTALFYYEQEQLAGFLSAYFFYEDAVEVALFVHPSFRRKGIGKKLLGSILPLIREYNFSKIIFSSPSSLKNQWSLVDGCMYMHSEYYMERNALAPVLDYKNNLIFRVASPDDIPGLCLLDEACFLKQPSELIPRFQQILSDRNYQIMLAFEGEHLVGKAHLRWEKSGATLSDIAILPANQGKGFGTALITWCINYSLSEGKPHLNLDVETHNQKALSLYTRLGFQTENACDYWKMDIARLQKMI